MKKKLEIIIEGIVHDHHHQAIILIVIIIKNDNHLAVQDLVHHIIIKNIDQQVQSQAMIQDFFLTRKKNKTFQTKKNLIFCN